MTFAAITKVICTENRTPQTTPEEQPITIGEAALAGMFTKTWGCRMFEYFLRLVRDFELSSAVKNGVSGDEVTKVIELR